MSKKTVNWGVLGVAGHFEKRMRIPWGRSDLSMLYAIASRDKKRADKAAVDYNIPRSYGSYEDLLADTEVQAVYIPVPNHLHGTWIRKAADAGKHILCEKPLCLNAAEVAEVMHYCKERRVLLMEAFMYKLHPRWQYVRELVRSGAVGNLTAIQSHFFFYNDDDNDIRNKYKDGGGALYDIGCYGISTARYITGAEPKRVLSHISRKASSGVDTLCSACMDFGDIHATFTVGTLTFSQQQVQIFGTGGYIAVDIPFNAYPDTMLSIHIHTVLGVRTVSFPPADQYLLELDAFSEAVLDGKQISDEDALCNMKVIDALFESEKKRGWVEI